MGTISNSYLSNPFARFHEKLQEYPDFLDDMDDVNLIEYDNWERFKPFKAKAGTAQSATPIIPIEDNDQKFFFYDLQGESLYTNPPDSNMPSIDHGLDEENIWSFPKTAYNQLLIKNDYMKDPERASSKSNIPKWGYKLITPSFFKPEKVHKLVK